jgi:putative ABC transport system permease protein
VVSLVLKSSVGMALLGIVIGLGMTLVAGRFIQPLLFETSSRDSAVLSGVAFTMLTVALLAGIVPALRAKGTDPMEALRTE